MQYRALCEKEIAPALKLVWEVFLEYEAPDYGPQGTDEFYRSIRDPLFLGRLRWYGAFQDDELTGVLATCENGSHIALFFVDGKHQRKGIGRRLFELAVQNNCTGKTTVNASPYALPVYRRLGFQDTDTEQVANGMRFTPMEYRDPTV